MGIFDFFKKKENVTYGGVSPVVLIVLDGWGVAPASPGNAITQAKKPNMDKFYSLYPHGELIAAGESVGLPANEVGNTEVGHLNLGAGRLILQDLKRIDKSILEGGFFQNRAFLAASQHVQKNASKLHVIGLVSRGRVHSSLDHFYALVEFCKRMGITNVYYHLFTDGRDASPNEAVNLLPEIEEKIKSQGVGKVATISGRYFAMDRDRRWERTKMAYDAMVVGRGLTAINVKEAVQASYNLGKTDEFIEPTIIDKNGLIQDGDAVVFFNYRIDRPRQLTMAFTMPNFESLQAFEFGKDPERGGRKEGEVKFEATFKREKVIKNLFFLTMTEYNPNIPVSAIAFPTEKVKNTLSEYLATKNLKQMHMAESEKERFVTFYFNGLNESRFSGEELLIVPSPKVATYDKKPQMSLFELVGGFKKVVSQGIYNFILVNIANPDMVAHSGNLPKTIEAIAFVDKALGEMVQVILSVGGTAVITADHGNAEELLTYPGGAYFYTTESGIINTDHSNSPVPVIIIGSVFQGNTVSLSSGTLADIAPTILGLMKIEKPVEMTGKNLLEVNQNGNTRTI